MRALAVIVFILISSSSFADTSERFGKGGWYKDFQPEIERANSSGELFRIKGHCQSLCTLFLGLRNASSAAPRCCFTPVTTASATSTPAPRSGC